MAADYLLNKDETDVVTVGLDDTTKAAGHKKIDIKANYISVSGPSKSKTTMTTGYSEKFRSFFTFQQDIRHFVDHLLPFIL